MIQGHYIKWNPLPPLADTRMTCEALHDDWEGFRIWLRPENGPMLIVSFPSVLYHAKSDDGARLAPVANSAPLELPHTFWQVTNSALIAEFHRQSCNTREDWNITHYAFLATNEGIDVLSTEAPIFHYSDEQVKGRI
jgi:hypothetical protein